MNAKDLVHQKPVHIHESIHFCRSGVAIPAVVQPEHLDLFRDLIGKMQVSVDGYLSSSADVGSLELPHGVTEDVIEGLLRICMVVGYNAVIMQYEGSTCILYTTGPIADLVSI